MNFDPTMIVLSLVFSGVGFAYFRYGKTQTNFSVMLTGLGLMMYSYFVDSWPWSLGIGIVLSALPFMLKWWQ